MPGVDFGYAPTYLLTLSYQFRCDQTSSSVVDRQWTVRRIMAVIVARFQVPELCPLLVHTSMESATYINPSNGL